MALFAIGDTHLSLATGKSMDVFGGWTDYEKRLESQWKALITDDDFVVIPGDISWAMSLEEVKKDFPDYTVVAYINTTAELKTVCDVCVTSSSAVKIVKKNKKAENMDDAFAVEEVKEKTNLEKRIKKLEADKKAKKAEILACVNENNELKQKLEDVNNVISEYFIFLNFYFPFTFHFMQTSRK